MEAEHGFQNNESEINAQFGNFNWVIKALDKCFRDHATCAIRGKETGQFVPTRLIDLSTNDSQHYQIIDTAREKVSLDTRYAALSHRWHNASFLTLQDPQTLHQLMGSRNSVDELPKTFREAARVTQQLGLQYLWIDALCIIQNSDDDWKYEANRMGEVYEHCYVNIATPAASDPHDGFMKLRDTNLIRPCVVQSKWQDQPPAHYSIIDESFTKNLLNKSGMHQRAWIMQERFLAPRTVHFGTEQVFIECRELGLCETFPEGVPPTVSRRFKDFNWLRNASRITHGVSDAHQFWNQMIQEYSPCELTKESDRLVALAGIARLVGDATGDRYVAGLWLSQLPDALLWRRSDYGIAGSWAHPKPQRPSNYVAPSWSWASLKAPVQSGYDRRDNRTTLVKVVGVSVVNLPKGVTYMGVGSAKLQIDCLLLPVDISHLFKQVISPDRRNIDVEVFGVKLKGQLHLDQERCAFQSAYIIPIAYSKWPNSTSSPHLNCILTRYHENINGYTRLGVIILWEVESLCDAIGLEVDEIHNETSLKGDSVIGRKTIALY